VKGSPLGGQGSPSKNNIMHGEKRGEKGEEKDMSTKREVLERGETVLQEQKRV